MNGLLTNPYIIYPGFPFSGYNKLIEYNNELKMLHSIFDSNDVMKNELLFLVIGAVMEEMHKNLNEDIGIHWRQLFPLFLEKFIDNNYNKKISIIIVSPNKSFSIDSFSKPLFMEKTNYKYKWIYLADRYYGIKNTLITVRIVYSMFPHNHNKNKKIIKKLKNSELYKNDSLKEKIDKSIQTYNDKKAIDEFYSNLNDYFNKINELGGLVITLSYSVFDSDSINSKLNNYFLFSEIKDLFINSYNKRILAEWVFELSNYDLNVYNKEFSSLSYVDDKIEIIEIDNNLEICKYLDMDLNEKLKDSNISREEEPNDNKLLEFPLSDPIKIIDIHKLRYI